MTAYQRYSADVPRNADPVGLVEIAQRLGVERQTAKTWKLRNLLPTPPWVVSGAPAWDWPDIERWATKTGRFPPRKDEPKT